MAEFTKIMEIRKRMCNPFKMCTECPLFETPEQISCADFILNYPKEAEEIILKWAEEHPVKTRLTDFLEKYPNAQLHDNRPIFCCMRLGYKCDNCGKTKCKDCWNTALEED